MAQRRAARLARQHPRRLAASLLVAVLASGLVAQSTVAARAGDDPLPVVAADTPASADPADAPADVPADGSGSTGADDSAGGGAGAGDAATGGGTAGADAPTGDDAPTPDAATPSGAGPAAAGRAGDAGDAGDADDAAVRGEKIAIRSAAASSHQNETFLPANAIDGDPTTRWSSADGDGESITVDLGATYVVDTVVLGWETAAASAYTVETSLNGWSWTTFADVTGAGAPFAAGGDTVTPDADPVRAQFVRVTGVTRTTNYGISLFELSVYGTDREEVPSQKAEGENGGVLLSYRKPATASSQQDDAQCRGCTPDKVTDQDLGTRWAVAEADWSDDAWIQVDLGGTAELTQVVLRWDPAFASSYSIWTSDTPDGPRTQVYGTTVSNGGKDVVDLSGTGRYVLLQLEKRGPVWGGPYGYSLYEFRIYGVPGDDVEVVAPPAQAVDPDFDALELVWSDEFDAPAGAPADPTRWTMDPSSTWTVNNRELQLYTDDAHNVWHDGDGHLVLEARRETFHGAGLYTSARLNTSHKLHAQYGRYEARIKVPEGQGLWPAFWMMGENFLDGTAWPSNGEIDIMEVLGHATETTHATIHGPNYSGMGGQGDHYTAASKFSDDFHVWAVEWDSVGIRFFVDDVLVYTATKAHIEDDLNNAWVYDQPFYMILNLAVGGEWPGNPDDTTPIPAQMLVDYVRVYQSPGSGVLIDDFETSQPPTGPGGGTGGGTDGGTGGGTDGGTGGGSTGGGTGGGTGGSTEPPVTVDSPALSLSASRVAPGGQVTVTGTGFAPDQPLSLWFASTPVHLRDVAASAAGGIHETVTIPTDATPGVHHVQVRDADGTLLVEVEVTVVAAGGSLAQTGGDGLLAGVLSATVLVGLGALGVVVARRRVRTV